MQDNYEGGVRVRASADWDFPYDARCYSGSDVCLAEWLEHGQSILGEAGAPLSFTYRSSVSENEDADLFFFGTPGVVFTGFFPGYSTSFAFDPPVFTWSIVKMQTGNAAGTVTLKSSNPRDVPVINFNYSKRWLIVICKRWPRVQTTSLRCFKTLAHHTRPWRSLRQIQKMLTKL